MPWGHHFGFRVQEALGFFKKKSICTPSSKSRTRWSVIPLARSLVAPGQNGRQNRPLWMAESRWNREVSPSRGVSFLSSYPKVPRNPSYNFHHTRAQLEVCLAKIPSLLISLSPKLLAPRWAGLDYMLSRKKSDQINSHEGVVNP